MLIETKVCQKTIIPELYINKYDIESDDVIEWYEEDGMICLTFRKKVTIKEMIGAGQNNRNTNAVQLEDELYQ